MRISLRLVKLLVKHAIVRDGSSDTRSVQSGNVVTTLIGIYTYICICLSHMCIPVIAR